MGSPWAHGLWTQDDPTWASALMNVVGGGGEKLSHVWGFQSRRRGLESVVRGRFSVVSGEW